MAAKPTYEELEKKVQELEQTEFEHKRAEKKLLDSEEKFRQIFNNILDVYYEAALDGTILEVSPSIEKHSQYQREELIGKSLYDIYTNPADRDKLIESIINKGIVKDYEINLTDKDGSQHICSMNIALIKDDADNPSKLVGIVRDITERKHAEEELILERTFVDAIFNSIPGMLYLYDSEGRLIRWNKKHEIMTGYSSEELSNMHLLDWYKGDAESQKAVTEGIIKTMERGFGEAEANLQKKDGTIIPSYFTASPLTINGKQYFTGIGIDITERKRAEEERVNLQAQLSQAQKMESVGRLAGGVAHDFNNMLGVILGHTEMALDRMDPDHPFYADLQDIRKAGERSADLVRQLLGFARKQAVAPKVLDLNETVEGMLTMLRRLISEDIALAWMPGKNLWPVKIDPSQIDQILANLCVNARDAIAGVGELTIETGTMTFDEDYCSQHQGFVPGEYVLLAVSDTGCGMNTETLDNLFEPFFTTKKVGKGTGLGLATVYGIVKQNNGFINVYSEPEQGTTFRIYLPGRMGKAEQILQKTPAKRVIRGNETILLVEDEPTFLNMTTVMLQRVGYTVLAAATPGEAICLAREHKDKMDLLMTDVVMPEMNGRDLAKKFQSLYPNLKCLFMSGYTANVITRHGVLNAGVHFIQKPFNVHQLTTKIREVLDQTKSSAYE